MAFADVLGQAFISFVQAFDAAIYRELRDIAAYITAMEEEIGRLQPHELKARRIPEAGQELDAIVASTKEATNMIMALAESVLAAEASDPRTYRDLVEAHMMQIFEACSFQDLTGQRIARVVTTLQQIETRISRFSETVRIHDIAGAIREREAAYEARRKALLLNGPQDKGKAIAQSEVDALFG
jgi:chemotaxis protein CheZ